MRHKTHALRAPAQRTPTVMGLIRRVITAAAGRPTNAKPARQDQEKDLDQRVREVGEW